MAQGMSQVKATAYAHMNRDMKAGGTWACACEACESHRALVGMDKVLAIWPLVRDIEAVGRQLDGLPDGPEQRVLQERYHQLYETLATTVARPHA